MSDQINFIENLIQHLSEQFLGIHREAILKKNEWGSKKRRAMFFRGSIEVRLPFDHKYVQKLDYFDQPRRRRDFEVIVTERHEVFVNWKQYEKCKPSNQPPIPEDFENTGNHDSCWCSSGFTQIQRNYFDMCEQLNTILVKHRFKEIAPIKMQVETSVGSWLDENPLLFCEVEVEPRTPGESYFLKLKSATIKKVAMDFVEEANANTL